MRIKINNNSFDVQDWIDQNHEVTIKFYKANSSLGELASIFESAQAIEIYNVTDNNDVEEEEYSGIWYLSKFISITREEENNYSVRLTGSFIDDSKEERLSTSLSDTEDALFEIADIVSTLEETQKDSQIFLDQYKERVEETIRQSDAVSNAANERFNEQTTLINNLSTIITDARVTLNKVQDAISSMPINVNERIGLLESRFNILADRIATLENRN